MLQPKKKSSQELRAQIILKLVKLTGFTLSTSVIRFNWPPQLDMKTKKFSSYGWKSKSIVISESFRNFASMGCRKIFLVYTSVKSGTILDKWFSFTSVKWVSYNSVKFIFKFPSASLDRKIILSTTLLRVEKKWIHEENIVTKIKQKFITDFQNIFLEKKSSQNASEVFSLENLSKYYNSSP